MSEYDGMGRDVDIAPAERDEMEAVVDLWRAAGLTRPWNDPVSDAALALSHDNSAVLVAHEGGRIVGAVMTGHDGHRGAVYYLAVASDRRRRGIGEKLIRAAEAWCRARGMPKVNLLVRKENSGVLAFYEALGYADTDSVCLYGTLDPERAEHEKALKAEWKASRSKS